MNKVWNSGGAAGKGYYGTYLMLFTRKAAILNEILFPERRLIADGSEWWILRVNRKRVLGDGMLIMCAFDP